MREKHCCRIKSLLLLILIMFTLSVVGCQRLMEQEDRDPARTTGKETYTGFKKDAEKYTQNEVIDGGGMVCENAGVLKGKENWDTFQKKVQEKEKARIRIMQVVNEDEAFLKDVIYDGKTFRLVYSENPEEYDYTYKYLMDLRGRRTESAYESRLVLLTNKKNTTFEDAIEKKGRFKLLFRER